MPRKTILTDLERKNAMKLVRCVAKSLDFAVKRTDDDELKLQQGSLVASLFLGAFIAYCNFRVTFEEEPDDRTFIAVERNTPWWTGLIGVNRVSSRFNELVQAIKDDIREEGGRVLRGED